MLVRVQTEPKTGAPGFKASLVATIINKIWLSHRNVHFGLVVQNGTASTIKLAGYFG